MDSEAWMTLYDKLVVAVVNKYSTYESQVVSSLANGVHHLHTDNHFTDK